MEEKNNVQVSKPEDLELNPFIHFAKHKPKKAIIMRWIIFSVVLTILTVIVANTVPYSFDQLNNESQEGMPDINQIINENPSAQSFLVVIQGISAFFTPIIFILLTTVGLKILTSVFRPIFKEKVSIQNLFLATTIAYTILFISSVLRLLFSIFKGEFLLYSLGSLPYYTGLSENGFFMNFLNSLDLFTLIYCGLLAFGLYSYTKAKLKPVFALIFGIYFIFIIGQSLLFPPV
ncbi:magnesium-transporting ATPase (P-type) [Peribacillus simplex]